MFRRRGTSRDRVRQRQKHVFGAGVVSSPRRRSSSPPGRRRDGTPKSPTVADVTFRRACSRPAPTPGSWSRQPSCPPTHAAPTRHRHNTGGEQLEGGRRDDVDAGSWFRPNSDSRRTWRQIRGHWKSSAKRSTNAGAIITAAESSSFKSVAMPGHRRRGLPVAFTYCHSRCRPVRAKPGRRGFFKNGRDELGSAASPTTSANLSSSR